jgi:hypothetical protein
MARALFGMIDVARSAIRDRAVSENTSALMTLADSARVIRESQLKGFRVAHSSPALSRERLDDLMKLPDVIRLDAEHDSQDCEDASHHPIFPRH